MHLRYLVWLLCLICALGPALASPSPTELRSLRRRLVEGQERYRWRLFELSRNLSHQFSPGYKVSLGFREGMTFTQGEIFRTSHPLEVAVNGRGLLVFQQGRERLLSRDGRVIVRPDGTLADRYGHALLAFPLDEQGNLSGDAGPVGLPLDAQTKLYLGRFTGVHIDEAGTIAGEVRQLDPVTGQQSLQRTPLFRIALAQVLRPESLRRTSFPHLWRAPEPPVLACAGGAEGVLVPSSLELSNADFAMLAVLMSDLRDALQDLNASALPARASADIVRELLEALERDGRLREACLENALNVMTPGFQGNHIVGYLDRPGSAIELRAPSQQRWQTGDALDVALDGNGYLCLADGRVTRCGVLERAGEDLGVTGEGGKLVGLLGFARQGEGFRSQPEPIRIPREAEGLEVSELGQLRWTQPGWDGVARTHYRLALCRPLTGRVVRAGLHVRIQGSALVGMAGERDLGLIVEGALEKPALVPYEQQLIGECLRAVVGLREFRWGRPSRPSGPPTPEGQKPGSGQKAGAGRVPSR